MNFKSFTAKLLIFAMIFQIFASLWVSPITSTHALDADWTANLNMTVSSTVEPESIIGTNFTLDISLSNANSSESDAFAPGFIITLPPDVVFVSSGDLWAPVRTEVLWDGSTVLFFETDGFIPTGTSDSFSLNLSSSTSATLFTPTDIDVLAYAQDNIYGVWAPPSGSPGGTLPGWYDYAGSVPDPTDPDFPDNIDNTTDLSTLPFFPTTTQFIPFDIEKLWPGELLIGEVGVTTLQVTGNNLGPLNDFEIVDVIPNNRKFVGFTSLAWATTSVAYDNPSAGLVTLTISNIDVPLGWVVDIQYETLALAYEAASYSGTTVLLNTWALINDQTISTNTATHQVAGTWDDGTGPVAITPTTVISPQDYDAVLSFGILGKSVSNPSPVIWDIIRYTISYDVAQNMSYDSSNWGTQIEDLLPDWLSFDSLISSTNSGWWDALSLTTNTISPDGDTTLIWTLWAGDTILAGDFLTIEYDVLVDGLYEWAGDVQFENTQTITNTADFSWNIIDSGNDEEWGYTDPSFVDTQDTDTASAAITAPSPTNNKHLVRVEFPDGTIYDSATPIPAGIGVPVGSRLDFNVVMDFPNVYSTGAKLVDALPLVTGPNTDTYNIAFQTTLGLLDITGAPVPINDDDDDGTADTSFNGQTLWGTTPTDTAWIDATPANNLEFNIGGWTGAKTFSVWFSVDVLPIAPSGGAQATLPIKNVLIWSFNNDAGTTNALDILNEPFVLGFPIIEILKDVNPSPTTDIAFGDSVTYDVVIQNTGDAAGYLENIIDTLPANMNLDSFSAAYSWSAAAPVPGVSVVQSGSTLEIGFDTQAPLNRSFLNIDDTWTTTIDESTILLTYTVSPTVDFVIVWWEARTNTIALDYYSTNDAPSNDLNKLDSIEDEAEFTVASPTITRTYFSTSEADSPDNQPWGRPDIHAWEESVFETTITLPPGTYTNSRFTEALNTTRLNFISGSVISTWPDLSFSNGTSFSSNIADFWDVVNSGSWPQTIVIRTTAIGRNDTTRFSNIRARWDFRYSGQTIRRNTPVNLIIPTLIVTKDVTPVIGDTSNTLTYTLEIEHTGTSNATAYDILLKDVLPPNISYITGSLTWNGNFTGSEADLFSWTWIELPSLADGSTETLTFQAAVWSGAVTGVTERNNTDIAYSSLDNDGSPVEANYTAVNFADFTPDDIAITHYISATNNPDTGTSAFTWAYDDLTIWEEVTYTIEVDVPELLYSGVTITQTLPTGIEFLTWFVLTDGVTSHTIDTFTINPDGTITFDFWDIDNIWPGAGTGFVLQTTAVVTNIVWNNAWDIVNSDVQIDYNSGNSKSDNSPNFDVVEPWVTITKVYTPDSGDGWDSILTTITITNPGTAPLYDITWSDTLPPKTTGDGSYLATSSTWVLLPGQSITYTYNTILDSTVVYGEMLTGTASVMWDSMPWVADEQRDYSDTASDIITITGITGLMKDLTSSWSATVWDIESYVIMVPVSEWVTWNITVNDLIPAWMEIIPWSVNISSSGWVTYSWAVTPTIGSASVWSTQTVDYVFSDITNSDTDNAATEYITITYGVVVLNTTDVNDGDIKVEDVTVNYNSGATILDDGPVPVNIVEPNVGIDFTSTYTYGNDVLYTYTITNTWSATAYDLNINSILPAGLTYSGVITITNSGWVVGIIQAGEDFTIEELPVNTWSPLQFTIAGVIDGTVDDMDDLIVDADLTYTGQDDSYTAEVPNPDNAERTGDNTWENDYLDTDPDTITVLLPILDEDITVVDVNGWLGIIGDVFEYTITLTNTWSVDLTDISALLDIPAGFTGFTIITTPSGSTDSSTSTGWTDGAGQVDISDIDLLIWQSITIVYQVTALDTVPSGTTINSDVVVSDTPEGAIWWNPDIDVTILAPGIQLTKIIDATSFNDPVVANDTITYQLIAENTGDVPLYNVVVSDTMLWWDITASCSFPWTWSTLDVTESAICNPASYSLTSSDIIRWYVENSAEVTSQDESMNPVNDISDSGLGNEWTETTTGTGATDGDTTNDPTVQALSQEPELTVTKIITATWFNVPNLVGDTIAYQITIENTWNLNVTGMTVTDPLFGWDITWTCSFPTDAATWLDVDEVATCTPPNYSIDANDIIRGYVDNNATARGTDALWDPVSDVSDPGDESTETPSGDGTTTDGDATNDPTTVEIIGEPELRVAKVISWTSLSAPTASGDTIDYTITIFNSGQLPIDTITLTDVLLGWDITSSCSFPINAAAWLQVGESATCIPASYVINEVDIVRDYVDNNATANGLDPNDDPVIDVSDPWDELTETPAGDGTTTDGDSTNDPTVQMLTPNPDWEIRKSTNSTPERVWETLEYVFELENTGNITINTPTVVDAKCSSWPNLVATSDISSDGRLSPNETWTYTCTSIPVTQDEVNNQSVSNIVTASGTTVLWNLSPISDTTDTFIPRKPEIQLYKSWVFNDENGDGEAEFGETISYNFTVRNTWNVDLTNVTITDPLITVNGWPLALLPVNGVDTTTFTGSYFILQPDVIAWYVENTAVTQAQDIDGTDIFDTSDAWDDTLETASWTGTVDSDPTNDPTVITYSWIKTSTASSSSGGWSGSSSGRWSSSSSSSSSSTSSGWWSSSSSSSGWSSSSSSSGWSSTSGGSGWSSSSSSTSSSSGWPVWVSPSGSSSSTSSGWDIPSISTPPTDTSSQISDTVQAAIENGDYAALIEIVKKYVKDHNERKALLERLIKESNAEWESFLKSLPRILPQTGAPILDRVKKITSPAISTDLPSEQVFRLAGNTNPDLNYWLQVLPSVDKNSSKYIIIPSNGLVMPINEFQRDSVNFNEMISGREWNINPALRTGALEYPGTSTRGYGDVGNKVIFGHSSYFQSSEGRYKTHFQKIIELDAGEQIWVYEKQENGWYKRFVYVTEKSYNTPASDTSVLKPWIGKNLTLFTCTPIWGIEWRWIIKAKYLDEAIWDLQREVYFEDVSPEYKKRIESFLTKLKEFPKEKQITIFFQAFARIDEVKGKYKDNQRIYRILEFLQFRIANEIINLIQ